MIEEYVRSELQEGMGGKDYFDDMEQFEAAMKPFYALFLPRGEFVPTQQELSALTLDSAEERVMQYAEKAYAAREAELGLMENGTPLMRELERVVMLRVVDEYWMDHIDSMQELRRGIGLRAFGNTQPIDAYKQEGFDMFEAMIKGIKEEVVRRMFTVRVRREQPIERKSVAKTTGNVGGDSTATRQPVKVAKKPGRNDPCPCGKLRPNGLPMKYKDCCGRNG
jgi:preprotein translocase subunit SecA